MKCDFFFFLTYDFCGTKTKQDETRQEKYTKKTFEKNKYAAKEE